MWRFLTNTILHNANQKGNEILHEAEENSPWHYTVGNDKGAIITL